MFDIFKRNLNYFKKMKIDNSTFVSLSQFVQDELPTSSEEEQVKDFLNSNERVMSTESECSQCTRITSLLFNLTLQRPSRLYGSVSGR